MGDIIKPSTESGTMSFWHGGNLDNMHEFENQKGGRYEFGSGLYLTTHYGTAIKYAKGSRKLYMITVEKGINMADVNIPLNKVMEFIKNHVTKNKQKEILPYIERYTKAGAISADIFNNIIINHDALTPSQTSKFRLFMVHNGVDYLLVPNAFGWHEMMIVVYNLNKIREVVRVNPKDKIEVFDLPTKWNE